MISKKIFSNKNKGMTFIEVLIALVILTVGILGSVAMLAVAKKSSFDALQRSVASTLAQDIVERMRGNSSDVLASYEGVYGAADPGTAPTLCNSSALCSNTQLATADIYEWTQAIRGADTLYNSSNSGGLVDGRGCIDVNNITVTITVTWQGKSSIANGSTGSCGSSGSKRREVEISAYII